MFLFFADIRNECYISTKILTKSCVNIELAFIETKVEVLHAYIRV
jgi:hypothetical protein